jgi:tRNA pseudouridine38-40 synthase
MPRYKLTVAYDGTDFHGWQKQHPPQGEPLRTAQGVLEDVVREVVREPEINLTGASRTDSGVHAAGQVAAFSCGLELDPQRMSMALNSRLPADMQVVNVEIVTETFGPITDCVAKGYRYRLAHGCKLGILRPLFDRHTTAWTSYDLDVSRMQAAAKHLVGEHDFASFTRLHHGRESTVRTVFSCEVSEPDRDRSQRQRIPLQHGADHCRNTAGCRTRQI